MAKKPTPAAAQSFAPPPRRGTLTQKKPRSPEALIIYKKL